MADRTQPPTPATGCPSHASDALLARLGLGLCVVDTDLVVRRWRAEFGRRAAARGEVEGHPLASALKAMRRWPQHREDLESAARRALDGHTSTVRLRPPRARRNGLLEPAWDAVASPWHQPGAETPLAALLFSPASNARGVRQEFERILDSTPDGVMVIDPTRRVRIFNAACGRLLGRDPREVLQQNCVCGDVVGCHLADGTSMADRQHCPAIGLFAGDMADRQTEEMLCTNEQGEERWVETAYSPVRDEAGNVEFVIGVIRDVHDRKVLEEKLSQSRKLASLGELTAGLAHEIKNPLGVLLSSVEIILDDERPREMQREAAEFIRDEVQRLDARMRGFLAFARPAPVHHEPTVLNSLVRRATRAYAEAVPGVAIELDLERPEQIVQIDPDQVYQVLANLLLNAADAASNPETGGAGTVLVRTASDVRGITLEVHDSGPGVPAERRGKVFDPFYTTKADGTGLGLSIVYQIVTAHGGSVEVRESKRLGGALLRLRLPFGVRGPRT